MQPQAQHFPSLWALTEEHLASAGNYDEARAARKLQQDVFEALYRDLGLPPHLLYPRKD